MWLSFLPISRFSFVFILLTTSLACPHPWEALRLPDGKIIGGASKLLTLRNESSHDKRWMQMVPGRSGYGALWPGGTIIYCMGDSITGAADLTDMRLSLQAAWKLWVDAGIDPNVQDFREGTAEDCFHPGDRALIVEISSDSTMHSNLGRLREGSVMTLIPSNDVGMGDKIANYAHEIGHAFGLLHEHQRPDLWTAEYGGTAMTPSFFFNCQNLKDFAALKATSGAKSAGEACKSYKKADEFEFSATSFLPEPPGGNFVAGGPLDLKSLMMYPSRAGGINPGTTLATRKLVYTLWDGTEILPRFVPSQFDVKNMKSLYPATAPQTTPCFAFQACSAFQHMFNQLVGCRR